MAIAGLAKASEAFIDEAVLKDAFLEVIELSPYEVKGEDLSISVYARSNADRRYAERFAESVVEVAYETIEKSTGHGLVIVGDEGEPHPFLLIQEFLKMEEEGTLTAEMSGPASELRGMLQGWTEKIDFEEESEKGIEIDFEVVMNAIPIPLERIASKLYLIAWLEDFEGERLKRKLESLTLAELQKDELLKYDWVFYLPPRSAFNRVLKELLPAAMDEMKLGFFKRAALRGAVAAFKPLIKDAIEGMRKGMLFLTVLRARSEWDQQEIETYFEAYLEALMPHGKVIPGKKKRRALEAIEVQKTENAEYAKNPFVSPEPLEDPDLGMYSKFVGEYGFGKRRTHRFSVKDGTCYWRYLDWNPGVFLPAGETLFVSKKGDMTIEFLMDDNGIVTSVEERWVRRKNLIPQRF